MSGLAGAFPDDVETLKSVLLAERARADRLSQLLKKLQRHRFGRRAETLPIDQLELGLEDVRQVEAAGAAEAEAKDPSARAAQTGRRRTNRGSLLAHLPRFERVIEPESLACPCCSGALHRVGEDVSKRLDIVPTATPISGDAPSQVRLPRLRGGRGASLRPGAMDRGRAADGGDRGPRDRLKYADHLPLYGQAQIYARQGVRLDRSNVADWTGRAA